MAMAIIEDDDEFEIEAELLLEQIVPPHADPQESTTAVDLFDDFLTNISRYIGFIEPCQLIVTLNSSILVTTKNLKNEDKDVLLLWDQIKQACALLQCHASFSNVLSLWVADKIYLFRLINQNAATFASCLNINQPNGLVDPRRDGDFAILVRYIEELEHFAAIEAPNLNNQISKLRRIDAEIIEAMTKRTRKSLPNRLIHYLCHTSREETLEDLLLARKQVFISIFDRTKLVCDLLTMIRHAFNILARLSTTLVRLGYTTNLARRFIIHLENVVNYAKFLSTPSPLPGTADVFITATVVFQLINSVDCPPMTCRALQLVEGLLCEVPRLANDWQHFGPSWKFFVSDDYDYDNWSLATQPRLQNIDGDVDSSKQMSLRNAHMRLVEQQTMPDSKSLKSLKERLFRTTDCRPVPLYFEDVTFWPARLDRFVQEDFMSEVKRRSGRAAIVMRSSFVEPQANFKVYSKERLEILEEMPNRVYCRVRNADGATGLVPTRAIIEIKLL